MQKTAWIASLLALGMLGNSGKPPSTPSSLSSLAQNHLVLPLLGLKNWFARRRRSLPLSDELHATCAEKRRDENPPFTSQVTVQVCTPSILFLLSPPSGSPLTLHPYKLFQWRYSDVALECQHFLGPNGYRYVQISPPHEHIQGPQWWTDYQPVSYRIASKRGTEAEFDEMIERCGRAGVGVIADVVLNHMSAGSTTEDRRGSGGSTYRKYHYPNAASVVAWRSPTTWTVTSEKVQNCELVGLADLRTSQGQVQDEQQRYLLRLVDKQVAGFRIDAAKHIPASDLLNILKPIPLRTVQEVMYVGGEPIRPEEYAPIGRVHVFQAAYDLKRMFLVRTLTYLPWPDSFYNQSDGIAYLGHVSTPLSTILMTYTYHPVLIFLASYREITPLDNGIVFRRKAYSLGATMGRWERRDVEEEEMCLLMIRMKNNSTHSQIFVTNWDLERNEHGLRMDQNPGAYVLSQVFILTWGYGQVDVFSGYNFTHYDDPPLDPVAQCGRFGWRCEHRHPMIVGAVRLGAAASGQPVQNIITVSRGNQVLSSLMRERKATENRLFFFWGGGGYEWFEKSGKQRLAFSRGERVFVALNNEDTSWEVVDVVVGLRRRTGQEGSGYRELSARGVILTSPAGPLIMLQPPEHAQILRPLFDPVDGVTRLQPFSVPPRSAIGILAV
ncbi:hypothetical protein VP01_2915g1 [Puccinia sorghi]|uniref:Alpha-amylase n=1 Tax=Puccinia sorghi TaxID=27349 RepID=A0A0L6V192_9BASI|nr:hypothetical protein VP01_2915g1 [Puccinia sorghi]